MIGSREEFIQKENEPFHFFEKKIRRERKKKSRRRLYLDLSITAAIVFLLFGVIAGIAVVQGDSMNPNLTDGSIALFYRLTNTYKRNDIILFKQPKEGKILIKRIVAIAGDTVDIDDETGKCLINGEVQDEIIMGNTYQREGGISFPYTVPYGCVFVLGDNREIALDSRNLGAIQAKSLIGKVFFEIKLLKG